MVTSPRFSRGASAGAVVCALMATCLWGGCGPDAAELSGSYVGTLKTTDREGMLTYMREAERIIQIVPSGSGDQVWVRVREECVAAATWEDQTLTLQPTRCAHDAQSYGIDAQITGQGTLELDQDRLTLSFELQGTITRAGQPVELRSTNTFEGRRR